MNAIAYVRVSTQQQGQSGLGLEAQQSAIASYCAANGATLIATYCEVESGKRTDRPELAKALAHARRSKATLIVAKLDRLARNVAFLSALMNGNVPFVACDNPHANRLTLHILAAVAESEAIAISERTKAALAARRARGLPLGAEMQECRNLTDEARERGRRHSSERRQELMHAAYADLVPIISDLRQQGLTLAAIADRLTQQGHSTRRGRRWTPTAVLRLLRMAEVREPV